MTFLDDVADLQAEAYGAFGVAAEWTPKGGYAVRCVLLPALTGDAVGVFGAGARRNIERHRFKVRVAELAASAQAASPATGDLVVLDPDGLASPLTIAGAPRREDVYQTEWTLELG